MNKLSTAQLYVLENIDDGVIVVEKGIISFANPALYDIFDIEKTNIVGKKIIDCFPFNKENSEFYEIFLDTIQNKHDSVKKIVPYYDPLGIEKNLKVSAKYMIKEESKESALVIIISNLTELSRVSNIFARYTSLDVANKILHTDEGDEIGGKKENISILFSDLRGFTAISEHIEPEIISRFISHYFEIMCEIIGKYNGTIIEFLGDGLFAVFGLDGKNKEHYFDAVAASVEMQKSMSEINEWNIANGYPKVEMGIGVNTGECMVGNIGSKYHTKFGVLGQPVNFCGRLESYTVGQQIYISEETYNLVKDIVLVDEKNRITPKGSDNPINIYSIYGIKGKYNIQYKIDLDDVNHIKKDINITFNKIINKNISQIDIKAVIRGFSLYYIVMTCDENINLLENIVFELYGTNYAKLVSEIDGYYTFRFTYVSKELREYFKCQFS